MELTADNKNVDNNNKGAVMKVTVEKRLDDEVTSTTILTVHSATELQDMLRKLEVYKTKEDAEFDFDVYYEKTYVVHQETTAGNNVTH